MLSQTHRLRGHRIPVVLKEGRRVHREIASHINRPIEPKQATQIGIIVPMKLSKKAVHRNRTKRLISESIRTCINQVKPGFEVLVMAKKLLREEKLQDVLPKVSEAFRKAELLTS